MKGRILNYISNKLARHHGEYKYQKLFRQIYEIGIYGMNYGNSAEFETSGEIEALNYAKKKLTGKMTFLIFDVGANVGGYSNAAYKLFSASLVEIHAFEPSKKIYGHLSENIGDNTGIVLNNFGLGQKSSKQTLYKSTSSSGLSSLYNRKLEHYDIEMNDSEDIEISTVDEYCKAKNIYKIDFLKIDVEGHEFGVLTGAKHMLDDGNIQFIQFEFGGTNIDSRVFFQDFFYLLKDRYLIYRIVKDGLVLIEKYKEELEIFMTINYLAELKPKSQWTV